MQLFDGLQYGVVVVGEGTLGDLHADELRPQAVLLDQLYEAFCDVREVEVHPGDVHRHRHGLYAPIDQAALPSGDGFPHMPVHGVDVARLFQYGDEPAGGDQLAAVEPAHQRLAADDLARLFVHLGLDVEYEFAVGQALLDLHQQQLVLPLVLLLL